MPQTDVLPCADALQPLHYVHGRVAAHRADVGCKVKKFVQQFSREKVRGKSHQLPGSVTRALLSP